jgi:predicted ATPase
MKLLVREFEAKGFRSLKAIKYPMSDLDVFVGANGVGKTNLYRGLELLRSAAANTLAPDLAHAGARLRYVGGGPCSLRSNTYPFAVDLSAEPASGSSKGLYRYEVEVGFPPAQASASFKAEPQIKMEAVSYVGGGRTSRLVDRQGASVMARAENGRPTQIDIDLLASETVIGRLEIPLAIPNWTQYVARCFSGDFIMGLGRLQSRTAFQIAAVRQQPASCPLAAFPNERRGRATTRRVS